MAMLAQAILAFVSSKTPPSFQAVGPCIPPVRFLRMSSSSATPQMVAEHGSGNGSVTRSEFTALSETVQATIDARMQGLEEKFEILFQHMHTQQSNEVKQNDKLTSLETAVMSACTEGDFHQVISDMKDDISNHENNITDKIQSATTHLQTTTSNIMENINNQEHKINHIHQQMLILEDTQVHDLHQKLAEIEVLVNRNHHNITTLQVAHNEQHQNKG